jgi:hypothetical protein
MGKPINGIRKFRPRCLMLLCLAHPLIADVTFVSETKISDEVMFFNGQKVALSHTGNSTTGYDYVYGNALTPHGDCIKAYKQFVFMTWYRGGKEDRHVMLTRYNTETGILKTIEFPHRHTGYNNKWWIGETHNTIAVGICPKNDTIHLLYDMHRNGTVADFADDYLRYSYSFSGAATVPDEEFKLDLFINSDKGNYKHLSFPGISDVNTTRLLTYPAFFTNDDGDLFMKMRFGYSENGNQLFARYDGEKWDGYHEFNRMQASNHGSEYNWNPYGDFKWLNGKLRIGFQRRSNDGNDKFLYQNGVYYAYSDDPTGVNQWKDPWGKPLKTPIAEADLVKIAEPGDWVETTQKDKVHIVAGFDFTVTDAGDEHFVSQVRDNQYNVTKKLHTYRRAGDAEFTTVEYDAGSELYSGGGNVYVIGLNGGRVNIVKTPGGSSDFQEVYQHTSGPTFDKGVVHVEDGIVYYYLKEAGGSGDKRTTYLQIFDLGIESTKPPIQAGRDRIIYDTDLDGFATVGLNGEVNPDYSMTDFLWTSNGEVLATELTASIELEFGIHVLELSALSTGETLADSVTITVIPESQFDPEVVVGWEKWNNPEPTVMNGATGSFTASDFWSTSSTGASDDGSFGSLNTPTANTDQVAENGDGFSVTAFSAFIQFVVTNGDTAIELSGFHFDAARSGTIAAEFQLEVMEGSAIDVGLVTSGDVPMASNSELVDFDVDLTALWDRRLEAGESATFKLSFTGAIPRLDFDNVAISVSPSHQVLGYPDTDNDHLPDYWEKHYVKDMSKDGSLDSDGDGRNNLQEFVEGTSPSNAHSFFQPELQWSESLGNCLVWNAVDNRAYRVMKSPDLSFNSWVVAESDFTDARGDFIYKLPEEGFYRLEAKVR